MQGDKLLSEILGFYKYKVDNNLCTPEEIKDAEKVLVENMEVYGTINDFAEFYGKSKDAVSSVIKRRMFEKPNLAVAIASDLGIDLESETPAYVAGDAARELADVICQLGCRNCHQAT